MIRRKITREQVRAPQAAPISVSTWRPFQVTSSERRPVRQALRTLFNLVPCNRSLETVFVEWCESAGDVAAFAKNAGPQALRIDYLSGGGRLAFYTPDFLVRTSAGHYFLVETKGRADIDVPAKARAAVEWCKAASTKDVKWEYLYVPEGLFERFNDNSIAALARMCATAQSDLLNPEQYQEALPLFANAGILEEKVSEAQGLVDEKLLAELPARLRQAADEAISLYRFFEKKPGVSYAPVFTALLGVVDEAAKGLILQRLTPKMPAAGNAQKTWFEPYLAKVDQRTHRHYQEVARNLQKTLVYKSGVSPLGLLRNSLEYALDDNTKLTGVFEALKSEMRFTGGRKVLEDVKAINSFRNTRVAHQESPLTSSTDAKAALVVWIQGLHRIWQANQPTPERSESTGPVDKDH